MSEVPQIPPIPVELYETRTTHDNGTEITVQFEDKMQLSVELAPDSDEAVEFLAFLNRLVNDKIRVVAARGIEITGFTKPEGGDD